MKIKNTFLLIVSLLFTTAMFAQDWDGENTIPGKASIGTNYLSSNKKFYVYNSTDQYGIYSSLSWGANSEVKRYAIYANAPYNGNWALYANGKVGVKGDIEHQSYGNNGNKWLTHLGFNTGSTSYSILPYDENGVSQLDRGFSLSRAGTMTKYVDDQDVIAFVVRHMFGGKAHFQVMGSGDVYARSLRVTMSDFPDYVFADTYDLMPLKELKAYITKHKHLPNVPSEKEIVAGGMDVGEMQSTQMEKIEELTLYLLELNEELEELKVKNKMLNERLLEIENN